MKNDKQLAKRCECAFALSHKGYIDVLKPIRKEADYFCHGQAVAAFAGRDDILTQVLGLGFDKIDEKTLLAIEQFYQRKGAVCAIELSPLADKAVVDFLNKHHYITTEFSTVLYKSLNEVLPNEDNKKDLVISEIDDHALWSTISLQGFFEQEAIPESVEETFFYFAHIPTVHCFLVLKNDVPIAATALGIYDKVCDLGFASTLPAFRGLGAQKLLLNHCLRFAKEKGCELAIGITEPGSISQSNMQKCGFAVAYTRIKYEKSIQAQMGN